MEGNKHYIRLEEGTNIVQRGFSDAFEEPQDGDICITVEGDRHFSIDGQPNPPMQHPDGCPRYLWWGENELTETDQAWRDTWLETQSHTPDAIRSKRSEEFEIIDQYQLTLVYNELTADQQQELSDYRHEWLDAPDSGVIPTRPDWMK